MKHMKTSNFVSCDLHHYMKICVNGFYISYGYADVYDIAMKSLTMSLFVILEQNVFTCRCNIMYCKGSNLFTCLVHSKI